MLSRQFTKISYLKTSSSQISILFKIYVIVCGLVNKITKSSVKYKLH